MEEDILNKFKDIVEESREECIYDYYVNLRNTLELLENLINRNKQLEADNYEQNNIINNYIEIEKEHKKENGELRERIKELETINKMQEYRISVIDERELILKSKVREKIEELEKEADYRTIDNPTGRIHFHKEPCDYQIMVLQELLGDDN